MWRNRIIFIILWILSVVGISWFGGPISYGFFLLLTSVPVVSWVYLLFVFLTYRIYQEIGTKNPVANHKIPYFITLQNEMPVLFASIRVRFYSSFSDIEGITDDYEYELSPKSGIKLETDLICKYRGEYEVGIKRIILTDFFKLFRLSFRNPEPLRVIVKPNLVSVDTLKAGLLAEEYLRESRKSATRPDVISRDYIPGDSMKKINWKATASSDKLLVRREEGEEKRGILLIPDTCRHSEDEHEYIPVENLILELVLAVSLYYVKQGIPVKLLALQKNNELLYTTVDSESGFEKYYSTVADIFFDDRFTAEELAVQVAGTGVAAEESNAVVVLGSDEPSSAKLLNFLESSGLSVNTYVADPDSSLEESV